MQLAPQNASGGKYTPHTKALTSPGTPGSQRQVGSPFLAGALKRVIKGVMILPLWGAVICFLPEKARELEKESWRERESEKRWAGSIMTLIIQLQQLWQRELHCSRELEPAAPSSHSWSGPLWPCFSL